MLESPATEVDVPALTPASACTEHSLPIMDSEESRFPAIFYVSFMFILVLSTVQCRAHIGVP
jgi:hypothetical protein